jgi:hypothetical protein
MLASKILKGGRVNHHYFLKWKNRDKEYHKVLIIWTTVIIIIIHHLIRVKHLVLKKLEQCFLLNNFKINNQVMIKLGIILIKIIKINKNKKVLIIVVLQIINYYQLCRNYLNYLVIIKLNYKKLGLHHYQQLINIKIIIIEYLLENV